MTKSILNPSVPLDHVDLLSARITQAQAIARAVHAILIDRLTDQDHKGLPDIILARMAWATDDLLEIAHHELTLAEQLKGQHQ